MTRASQPVLPLDDPSSDDDPCPVGGASPDTQGSEPARALSVVLCDSSSDDEWLHEICSAPRRTLRLSSSDETWLENLCCSSRAGGPSPQQSLISSTPPQLAPLTAPYTSQAQLVQDLAKANLHMPSPPWPLPPQDSIIRDALQAGGASPYGGRQALVLKCLWRIAGWKAAMATCIFKVGIAYDPADRWLNQQFGYMLERQWMFMDVMVADSAEECRCLEQELIAVLKPLAGCYNEKPGGEGISSRGGASPSCHCYAVYAPAGSGIGVHQEWLKRTRAADSSCA